MAAAILVAAFASGSAVLGAGSAHAVSGPGAPDAACSRPAMTAVLDGYLHALERRDPTAVPVAPDVRYTENGATTAWGRGEAWTAGGSIAMRRDVIDTNRCAAFVQAVLRQGQRDAVLGLRVQTTAGRITEVEMLWVPPGFPFAAPGVLVDTAGPRQQPEWDRTVPVAERASRAGLVGLADRYFDALNTSGTPGYRPVPFAPGCNRWENGVRTTLDNCDAQLRVIPFNAVGLGLTHRRYPVVDEEKGIVVAYAVFTGIWNMAEMFRVRNGEIQQIHAVMMPWTGRSGWEDREG